MPACWTGDGSSRSLRPGGRGGAVMTPTRSAAGARRAVAARDGEPAGAQEDGPDAIPARRPAVMRARSSRLEPPRPRRRRRRGPRRSARPSSRGSRCRACPGGGRARAGAPTPEPARPRDLELPADPVLGNDPDLLVARHVGDVAGDREAALEVAVVAVGADDLRVDELEQAVSTSTTQAAAARRAAARRAPRPGASRMVSVRSSSSSWRNLPKLSTVSPFSRRRGSPSMTMGRTLMTREVCEWPSRPGPGRGRRPEATGASTASAAASATRAAASCARPRRAAARGGSPGPVASERSRRPRRAFSASAGRLRR